MSVPFGKTVFLVDAMAFRRARAESFLNPWARNESVELISLDPDEAHTRLVERAMLGLEDSEEIGVAIEDLIRQAATGPGGLALFEGDQVVTLLMYVRRIAADARDADMV